MRFLVLSDIHGDLDHLDKLDEEFAACDCVVFAGDFAKFGSPETGLPVLNELVKKHETLFSVLGNCDEPSFIEELEKLDISVQGDMLFHDGLIFAGSGGALKFTGTTPNERTEEELVGDLNLITEQNDVDWNNLILLIHQPPFGTKADVIPSGIHTGSHSIRAFIEKYQSLAVITGHIHESPSIDYIGKTLVMNPGSLADGKYGILEASRNDGEWKIDRAELKSC